MELEYIHTVEYYSVMDFKKILNYYGNNIATFLKHCHVNQKTLKTKEWNLLKWNSRIDKTDV